MENETNEIFEDIFFKDSQGNLTNEIENIDNIQNFFQFLINYEIENEIKIQALQQFKQIIQTNRYIIDFFCSYENKSIYIFLFDLYCNENTSDELKQEIILLNIIFIYL